MRNFNSIPIAYSYDKWHEMGVREPISIDITTQASCSMLLTGMSGSGKTYAEMRILALLAKRNAKAIFYFGDFKQDDSFSYLRGLPRYFPYKRTIEALDIVYEHLQRRMSGEDNERKEIFFFWDEYVANILSLLQEDKRLATTVMNKVSELLMLGRSMNIRVILTCQRPDAVVFPQGSRQNFGMIMILGTPFSSIIKMLVPDHADEIGERIFRQGEGMLLIDGSILHFVKVPKVQNVEKMHEYCIRALS